MITVNSNIPEKHKPLITEFLISYWNDRMFQIEHDFGLTSLPPLGPEELLKTPLAATLADIASAADGTYPESLRGEIADAVQTVLEHLFSPPGQAFYQIPTDFWSEPFGWLLLQAHIWATGDELITVTQAAELSGKSAPTISQAIKRGALTRYIDPNESNPQHATRVLKSQVLK